MTTTDAIKVETERSFLETLNGSAAGRTAIPITPGVEKLDRIFRLPGGKAVASPG